MSSISARPKSDPRNASDTRSVTDARASVDGRGGGESATTLSPPQPQSSVLHQGSPSASPLLGATPRRVTTIDGRSKWEKVGDRGALGVSRCFHSFTTASWPRGGSSTKSSPTSGGSMTSGFFSDFGSAGGGRVSRGYLFGGEQPAVDAKSDNVLLHDLREYSFDEHGWRLVTPRSTEVPEKRKGASLSFYAQRNWLVLFGGVSSTAQAKRYVGVQEVNFDGKYFNDLWIFDLNKQEWIDLSSNFSSEEKRRPDPRAFHSGLISGDSLYIYGGYGCHEDREVWELKLTDFQWRVLSANSSIPSFGGTQVQIKPERRFGHCGIIWKSTMYIFGGLSKNRPCEPMLWKFNLETFEWTVQGGEGGTGAARSSSFTPSARSFPAGVLADHRWMIIGGAHHEPCRLPTNEVVEFNLRTERWRALPALSLPKNLAGLAGCAAQHEFTLSVVVAGGQTAEGVSSDQTFRLEIFNSFSNYAKLEDVCLPIPGREILWELSRRQLTQDERDKIQRRLLRAARKVEALDKELQAREAALSRVSSQLEETQSELATLQTIRTTEQKAVADAASAERRWQIERDELNEALEAEQRKLEKLRDQHARDLAERDQASKDAGEATAEALRKTEDRLSEAERELFELRKELAEASTARENERASTSEELSRLQRSLSIAREELEDASVALSGAQHSNATLSKQVAEKDKELETLKQENERMNNLLRSFVSTTTECVIQPLQDEVQREAAAEAKLELLEQQAQGGLPMTGALATIGQASSGHVSGGQVTVGQEVGTQAEEGSGVSVTISRSETTTGGTLGGSSSGGEYTRTVTIDQTIMKSSMLTGGGRTSSKQRRRHNREQKQLQTISSGDFVIEEIVKYEEWYKRETRELIERVSKHSKKSEKKRKEKMREIIEIKEQLRVVEETLIKERELHSKTKKTLAEERERRREAEKLLDREKDALTQEREVLVRERESLERQLSEGREMQRETEKTLTKERESMHAKLRELEDELQRTSKEIQEITESLEKERELRERAEEVAAEEQKSFKELEEALAMERETLRKTEAALTKERKSRKEANKEREFTRQKLEELEDALKAKTVEAEKAMAEEQRAREEVGREREKVSAMELKLQVVQEDLLSTEDAKERETKGREEAERLVSLEREEIGHLTILLEDQKLENERLAQEVGRLNELANQRLDQLEAEKSRMSKQVERKELELSTARKEATRLSQELDRVRDEVAKTIEKLNSENQRLKETLDERGREFQIEITKWERIVKRKNRKLEKLKNGWEGKLAELARKIRETKDDERSLSSDDEEDQKDGSPMLARTKNELLIERKKLLEENCEELIDALRSLEELKKSQISEAERRAEDLRVKILEEKGRELQEVLKERESLINELEKMKDHVKNVEADSETRLKQVAAELAEVGSHYTVEVDALKERIRELETAKNPSWLIRIVGGGGSSSEQHMKKLKTYIQRLELKIAELEELVKQQLRFDAEWTTRAEKVLKTQAFQAIEVVEIQEEKEVVTRLENEEEASPLSTPVFAAAKDPLAGSGDASPLATPEPLKRGSWAETPSHREPAPTVGGWQTARFAGDQTTQMKDEGPTVCLTDETFDRLEGSHYAPGIDTILLAAEDELGRSQIVRAKGTIEEGKAVWDEITSELDIKITLGELQLEVDLLYNSLSKECEDGESIARECAALVSEISTIESNLVESASRVASSTSTFRKLEQMNERALETQKQCLASLSSEAAMASNAIYEKYKKWKDFTVIFKEKGKGLSTDPCSLPDVNINTDLYCTMKAYDHISRSQNADFEKMIEFPFCNSCRQSELFNKLPT